MEPSFILALAVLAGVLLIGNALPTYLIWRALRQSQVNARAAQTGMLALSRSRAAEHVASMETANDAKAKSLDQAPPGPRNGIRHAM